MRSSHRFGGCNLNFKSTLGINEEGAFTLRHWDVETSVLA